VLKPLIQIDEISTEVCTEEPTSEWFGVRAKPPGCRQCGYRTIGQGFVPDEVPENPKIGILLEAPGQDEALRQQPMVGKAGEWFEKRIINKLGYKRNDVAFFNTIRCRPPGNVYPTGQLRTHAEQLCRQYDFIQGRGLDKGGIVGYNPNVFIATFHPAAAFRTPAIYRLILRDVEKAFRFAEKGFRPLVLAGNAAMELIWPWTRNKGGLRIWRSHWMQGEYPFHKGAQKEGFNVI
jgi:uracil DNA glycosylase superfamily protein